MAFSINDKSGDDLARRRRRRHSSGDRETWSRKVEYFFAGLGYAVGLGNIWRFPYLCYRNGGGAFLIPYTLALVAVGLPILFMEMSFGQFASLGPVTIWRVCPLFKGIGYAILAVLVLVNTYYNVLIAYALFYLFASITSVLPWSHCDNNWNTKYCVVEKYVANGSSITGPLASGFVDNMTDVAVNVTSCIQDQAIRTKLKTPTEEYFEYHMLKLTSGIEELGAVQWPLIVCLGVSWFTCFMCLFKGIKSMGKVVIFTTVFSYVVLTVLLVRGITLPGSVNGIIYYLKPDFNKLKNVQVWGEASAQAFASLSLGGGGWITLSSYNKFNNRCSRDAILVGIGNALTSFVSGFVIFAMLGWMAYVKGVPVDDVTEKGPGLAFIAYPEGLTLIPGAPFWSICFFFMMFTVGLDSLFGQVETIAAGIIDEYPGYLRPRRKLFTLLLCTAMFLMGIPLVTQGGIYIVTLMDWYTLLLSFSIISFFEIIVIIYIYGYHKFAIDIQLMIGSPPSYFYMVTWFAVSPVTLLCVIAFLCTNYVPAFYGPYCFPPWAESIGWALALSPTALIPIFMLIQFISKVRSFQRFKGLIYDKAIREEVFQCLVKPSPDWGPALPHDRRKFSLSLPERQIHSSGDSGPPADDIYEKDAVELKSIRPVDPEKGVASERDRLIRFSDEVEGEKETDLYHEDETAAAAENKSPDKQPEEKGEETKE